MRWYRTLSSRAGAQIAEQMKKSTIMRVARPTDNLEQLSQMYISGLGFEMLSSFTDHDGFNGTIIGHRNHSYHLEFTQKLGEQVGRAPTKDNLLVFYIPSRSEWELTCKDMEMAGFKKVESYNPFWDQAGKTFEDIDGYRVVIQFGDWTR